MFCTYTKQTFSLSSPYVSGEIIGNTDSKNIVIFSHGFGVKRDSRGMFTDLVERLKENHLCILFDYVDIDAEGNTTTYPLTEQEAMLNNVIKYIKSKYKCEKITVVGHSQGCIVLGLLCPDIDKAILTAPPISAPNIERTRTKMGGRPGTSLDENTLSKVGRSDGTFTYIPSAFWKDAKNIKPVELYTDLAEKTETYFIRARQDNVLSDSDMSAITSNPNFHYFELDGNHDFAKDERAGWLDFMVKIIRG